MNFSGLFQIDTSDLLRSQTWGLTYKILPFFCLVTKRTSKILHFWLHSGHSKRASHHNVGREMLLSLSGNSKLRPSISLPWESLQSKVRRKGERMSLYDQLTPAVEPCSLCPFHIAVWLAIFILRRDLPSPPTIAGNLRPLSTLHKPVFEPYHFTSSPHLKKHELRDHSRWVRFVCVAASASDEIDRDSEGRWLGFWQSTYQLSNNLYYCSWKWLQYISQDDRSRREYWWDQGSNPYGTCLNCFSAPVFWML